MIYKVGDRFKGTMIKDGRPVDDIYRGTIARINEKKGQYYIVWTYDNGDRDRHAWYSEKWFLTYMKTHNLKEDVPEVKLDEKLFEI